MRLTTFTDYALRTLIYLGAHAEDGHLVTIRDIASAYGISENHLMKVVHHLAKQGYVETLRGKGGGMRLACAPAQINVGAVVRGTEGEWAVVDCLQVGNPSCPIEPACVLRDVLLQATHAFTAVLDKKTLADLLQRRPMLVELLRPQNPAQRR
jgi:Rrf2 family nitric oxide-sensitive transcriptional repressor